MSCEKHPNDGIVWLGDNEICYGCYCEQFEYCPKCGRKWDDPLECHRTAESHRGGLINNES